MGNRQSSMGNRQSSMGKGQRAKGKEESSMGNRHSSNSNELSLPVPNGLICLKGGDLSQEIAESGCRPRVMEIKEIFDEPAFEEKYILYVPFKK
jgi:hypothetical protein